MLSKNLFIMSSLRCLPTFNFLKIKKFCYICGGCEGKAYFSVQLREDNPDFKIPPPPDFSGTNVFLHFIFQLKNAF